MAFLQILRYRRILFGLAPVLVLSGCLGRGAVTKPKLFSPPPMIDMSGHCANGSCQDGQGDFVLNSGGKYSGNFIGGRFNGKGKLTLAAGASFEGLFQDSRYKGGGKVSLPGWGDGKCESNTDCLEGRSGSLVLDNGYKYRGHFRHGMLNGFGAIITTDGKELKGVFADNLLNGQGTITTDDGASYRGGFVKGKMDGKVTIIFPSGSRFAGIFKGGTYVKNGKLTFPNGISGKCLSGDCVNGTGVLLLSDGGRYQGAFKDCRKDGKGSFTSADGSTYIGEYKKGKRHGLGTYIFPSGIKYIGTYVAGKRDGRGISESLIP